jgi:hypothetical protein
MAVTLNASTTTGLVQSADTSGTVEIQSNGTTRLTVASGGVTTTGNTSIANLTATGTFGGGVITSGTAVASTSGTSIDFTSIPSWVKRITVLFNGVSLNGSANIFIQLGTSGGVVSTGYTSTSITLNDASGSAGSSSTSAFLVFDGTASYVFQGSCVINLVSSNSYVSSHSYLINTTNIVIGSGSISLGGTLDRVRITTSNGTDTFDAGSINILYEG